MISSRLGMRPEIAHKIMAEFARLRNERTGLLHALEIVSKLTNAEIEIIRAVYHGGSYRDIAKARFVEVGTIKTQINHILKKFEMRRMRDVVVFLRAQDVVGPLKLDEEN